MSKSKQKWSRKWRSSYLDLFNWWHRQQHKQIPFMSDSFRQSLHCLTEDEAEQKATTTTTTTSCLHSLLLFMSMPHKFWAYRLRIKNVKCSALYFYRNTVCAIFFFFFGSSIHLFLLLPYSNLSHFLMIVYMFRWRQLLNANNNRNDFSLSKIVYHLKSANNFILWASIYAINVKFVMRIENEAKSFEIERRKYWTSQRINASKLRESLSASLILLSLTRDQCLSRCSSPFITLNGSLCVSMCVNLSIMLKNCRRFVFVNSVKMEWLY